MLLLELFSGTGSYTKAAKELGFDVISVDIVPKFNPTILMDILDWDYKTIPIPDIITASPPCQTFSPLIASHKTRVRDLNTMEPLTPKGELGDKLLFKTIEIIKYFLHKNPKLKFAIENPRGYMRYMNCMMEEPIKFMDITWYSMYGMPYRKPTNFWSNLENGLSLKIGDMKTETKITQRIETMKLTDKYKIPHSLCLEILTKLSSMGLCPPTTPPTASGIAT
jgi:site-specific DNA-cytosine methylase